MKRAKHNLSHYRVTAGDLGKLYPVSVTEVLPGDTLRQSSSALIRLQPLMTPLMHPLRVTICSFFVPNRLVWSGWEDFITGKSTDTLPSLGAGATTLGSLDYMGVPPGTFTQNALPTYGYNMIWNQFFRDQDLDSERNQGNQNVARVRWNKDYFTTARPSPQAGDTVQINFTQGTAPVYGIGVNDLSAPSMQTANVKETDGRDTQYTNFFNSANDYYYGKQSDTHPGYPDIYADLANATGGIDVNEWRRAMALQKFYEHRNKFGSRYKDYLAFLGIKSRDGRLDRPEYLGGTTETIAFSEVLQSVESTEVPLGTQGGHGIGSIRTKPFRRFFEEHGYVHTFAFLRPTSMYMQAVDRTHLRADRTDFWQKEDEMLGDQMVANAEIYGPQNERLMAFGYAPRHDDYRTQRSTVTGPMRDTEYNTWHMARNFVTQPALNTSFVECNPTNRVFRSITDPAFYAMIQNRITARRLVAKHARN